MAIILILFDCLGLILKNKAHGHGTRWVIRVGSFVVLDQLFQPGFHVFRRFKCPGLSC